MKLVVSFSGNAVLDSIHQLSHRPDHPWCASPKERLGNFLSVPWKTVHAAFADGLEEGLLQMNERGDLRSTEKWIENAVLSVVPGELVDRSGGYSINGLVFPSLESVPLNSVSWRRLALRTRQMRERRARPAGALPSSVLLGYHVEHDQPLPNCCSGRLGVAGHAARRHLGQRHFSG